MSRINMSFFNAYLELDKICAQKLEIKRGGVSEYINRLVELRFAPGRNEVLPKLLRYRKIRNIIAHEEHSFDKLDEITKADVKWINRFARSVNYKTDPISRYERKAMLYSIWKKIRLFLIIFLVLGVAVLAFVILKKLNVI